MWLSELENPEGDCRAHHLLYAYYNYTSSPDSSRDEACDEIKRYLNKVDISLARISWHYMHQGLDVVDLLENVQAQCLMLSECLKRYAPIFSSYCLSNSFRHEVLSLNCIREL